MTKEIIIDFKSLSDVYEKHKENDTFTYWINGAQVISQNSSLGKEEPATDISQIYKARLASTIRQYLRKSYDNIVFLSGAGTSIFDQDHADQSGPGMWSLAEYVDEHIHSEYGICLADSVFKDNPEFFDGKTAVDNKSYLFDHFEQYITYLESHPKTFADGRNFKEVIFNLIVNRISNINYDLGWKHSSVLNSLIRMSKQGSRPSVVTTNYDHLFEYQGENAGLLVVDGFSYGRTPKFQDSNFDLHLMVKPLYDSSDRFFEKQNAFNLLKLHGSLDWKKEYASSLRHEYTVVRSSENAELHLAERVMIFPSSNKYESAFTEPYFELMSRFQALLRMRNTLLIKSGFSFADMHILRMVMKASKENEQLSMLITDPKAFGENGELTNEFKNFSDILSNSHRIAMMPASFSELAEFMEQATKDAYDNAN